MSLSSNDAGILQVIIDLGGDCLDSKRCMRCPFRVMCLPEFLNPVPPTQNQREKMAIDVMMHHAIVDEEAILDIETHRWDRK